MRIRARLARALRGRRTPWRSRYVQDRLLLAAKATLAAAVAWAIGRYALQQGDSAAYWAPLSAVFVMNPIVARSFTDGAQYVTGFCLGVGVGIVAGLLIGPNLVGVVVVVFVAMLVASWSRLGQQRIEVPFIGLFVLLFGGNTPLDFVPPRLIEVGVGAAVGVLVNVAVLPPLHLRPAEHWARRLRDDVTALLTDMAVELEERWPPEDGQTTVRRARGLGSTVTDAHTAVRQADESVRYNPRTRRWGGPPRRTEDVVVRLESIATAVMGIADALGQAADGEVTLVDSFRAEYAAVLRDTAAMVDAYAIPYRRRPDTAELDDTLAALRRVQLDQKPPDGGSRRVWVVEGHLFVEVERVLGELRTVRS